MKRVLFFLFTALTTLLVSAQNVGIGTTTPNSSAMLEISSSNKGLLLPRVTDTSAVVSPAKGLIIYNNTNNKLWYYDGVRWQQSMAHAGGMDSIWFRTKDTIAYTMKPYVGINSDYSLIDPQANLQVNGSLLIQGKLIYSLAEPTAGQTYTMNNIASTQNIPSTDSVFRIYDPGGTGNYNNNMQGNMYTFSGTYCTGYKISSVAADFGLGTGDTLWISKLPYPGCKEDYDFMFTNTMINPGDFLVNSMYNHCNFIFRSNADGNNNKGFNFKVTPLFSNQPYKQINTSGPALSFNGNDGSFAAGNSAFAAGGSVAIGSNARASNYYSTAIGWTEATGYYSTAIGTGYYYPNVASGERSLAVGVENNATALYAAAIGTSNYASGERSIAVGQNNETSGLYTSAFGISNKAIGERSTSVGFSNRSKAFLSMAIGCYNDTTASVSATSWVATDPLLIVGNGTGINNRSNAMVVLKNGHVGIGTNSPALKLEVNNGDALIHGLTIGRGGGSISGNTAIGALSMENNTTGFYNTGVGYNALHDNTTGMSNIALGTSALRTNVGGNNAVAIGTNAMYYANNSSTSFTNHNIAIGYEALRGSATPANNNGDNNSALGYQAMQGNTGGDNNTAIGYVALISNTSGSSNTSIGYGSINNNITGSYNTALGRSAYFDLAALENTTCIGANSGGIVDVSNRIEIGNTSVTAIAGQVSFSTYSDGRIKDNIRTDVPGLSFINRLRPVSYNLNIHRQNEMVYDKERIAQEWGSKYDIEKMRMTGFIAQEVEQAAREVNFDFSGVQAPVKTSDLYSLRYSDFVMPLVKAAQELSIENIELKKQMEEMKARLEKLEAAVLKK